MIAKRIQLLLLAFISCPVIAFADPVGMDDARRAADTFVQSGSVHGLEKTAVPPKTSGGECIRNADGDVIAYVVNLEPEGFVITSADTRIKPILGYSKTGRFDLSDENGNVPLQMVKMDVAARFKALNGASDSSVLDRVRRNQTAWEDRISGVRTYKAAADSVWGPLIHTHWHQQYPYNTYCPIDPATGLRSIVGCGSIAATQVLYYWQYPRSFSFSEADAYVSKRYDDEIRIPEDAEIYDFPGFDELNNHLAEVGYGSDVDEIAMLLFGVGVKLVTHYSSNDAAILPTLDFLHNNGFLQSKVSMNWNDDYVVAIDNIKDNVPVLVSISSSVVDGNHAVVFDGYDAGEDMYHINFGWGNFSGSNVWYDVPVMREYNGVFGFYYDIVPDEAPHFTTVTGTVLDNTGEPVHLASVSIDNGRYHLLTDETGVFEFERPGFDTMNVSVQKPGYDVYSGVLTDVGTVITLEPSTDPTLAYYHFDGDGVDASGRGNDYIVNMDVSSWVEGKFGQALECRQSSLLSRARPEVMYPDKGDYTFEVWVGIPASDRMGLFLGLKSPYEFLLGIDSGIIPYFTMLSNENEMIYISGPSLLDQYNEGDFVHFAGVYRERESLELYVDGCLVANQQVSCLPLSTPNPTMIVGVDLSLENDEYQQSMNDPFLVMDEARFSGAALQPGEFIGGEFTGTLVVTVTDSRTGEVPEGVTAILEPGGYQASADDEGHAVFTGIPARDDYILTVRVPEYEESSRDSIDVATGGNTAISMALTPEVGVAEERQTAFSLSPPWPNPFNAGVTIQYEIPREGDVNLTVFNVIGQTVFSDFKSQAAAGTHTVHWSANDVPDGLYFVRVRTGEHTAVRKIMHVK